jgi:tetratricopeptide (TPR) repeat protein
MDSIRTKINEVTNLLDRRELLQALQKMSNVINDNASEETQAELKNISVTYNYLLQYMSQGINDPERDKVYNNLLTKTYELNDRILLKILSLNPLNFFFNERKIRKADFYESFDDLIKQMEGFSKKLDMMQSDDSEIKGEEDFVEEISKHEKRIKKLFYRIWLSDAWQVSDEVGYHKLFMQKDISMDDRSILVSAITLSLTEYFDARKFILLIDIYEQCDELIVNQRAIVGIMLAVFQHDRRIMLYPAIVSRLKLLADYPEFVKNLDAVRKQLFIQNFETEKMARIMTEEIIPTIMNNPEIRKMNISFKQDNINFMLGDIDADQDMKNIMEDSGINEKMRKLSDLQSEGVDLYLGTFAQLKRFPFFYEISNWFHPFSLGHPDVYTACFMGDSRKINWDLMNEMDETSNFCESDKYSLCFTSLNFSKEQRKIIASQLKAQRESLKEDETQAAEKQLIYSQHYINDLYRFFKIFSHRNDFKDPFNKDMPYNSCDTFKSMLNTHDLLLNLAEFLFHFENYNKACETFQEAGGQPTAEIAQKMGYCMQKEGEYEKAIKYLIQADLITPNNVWTNHHIAICYRQLKQYEKALYYFQKVDSLKPDSPSVSMQLGICLFNLKQFEKALNSFFKVEYLQEGKKNIRLWRYITRCSLYCKKLDQADKYCTKAMESDLSHEMYLLEGHIAWAQNRTSKAIDCYTQAAILNETFETFWENFKKDIPALIKIGFKENDLSLMPDIIWKKLQK